MFLELNYCYSDVCVVSIRTFRFRHLGLMMKDLRERLNHERLIAVNYSKVLLKSLLGDTIHRAED